MERVRCVQLLQGGLIADPTECASKHSAGAHGLTEASRLLFSNSEIIWATVLVKPRGIKSRGKRAGVPLDPNLQRVIGTVADWRADEQLVPRVGSTVGLHSCKREIRESDGGKCDDYGSPSALNSEVWQPQVRKNG